MEAKPSVQSGYVLDLDVDRVLVTLWKRTYATVFLQKKFRVNFKFGKK